jgi:hypothetical protein
MKVNTTRPFNETTPARIRRVCGKSFVWRDLGHPFWKGFGLFLLVLGILVVGVLACVLVTDLMEVYRERLGTP